MNLEFPEAAEDVDEIGQASEKKQRAGWPWDQRMVKKEQASVRAERRW